MNKHLVNPDQMNFAHHKASPIEDLARLFSNGEFGEVIVKASELQKKFPNSHIISNAMGCAFLELNQIENATEQFQKATLLNEDFAEPFYNLAVVQKRRGNIIEARNYAQLAIEKDLNLAKAYMLLAECCEELHMFAEAIKNYRYAERDRSTRQNALTSVARLLNRVGTKEEALDVSERLLHDLPNDEQIQNHFITACLKFGEHTKAIKFLKKAAKTNQPSSHILKLLGDALSADGQTESAVNHYEKALKIDPNNTKILEALTKACRVAGKTESAVNYAEKWVRLDTNNVNSQHQLGWCYHESGDSNKALTFAKNACTLAPHFIEAQFLLAKICDELGLYAAAVEQHENIIANLGWVLEAHNSCGVTLNKMEKFQHAEEILTKLLKLVPNYHRAIHNLADTYSELNQIEKAVACYKKSIHISPEGKTIRSLARLYKISGQNDKASSTFLQAIDLDHRDQYAYLGYTTCVKIKQGDPVFAKLKKIASEQNDRFDDPKWYFALAKCFDDCGDANKAFNYYKLGNDLNMEHSPYDLQLDRNSFSLACQIQEQTSKAALPLPLVQATPIPIFIVGMPRSGTTMVDRVISSHSDVTGYGELDFMRKIVEDMPHIPQKDLGEFYKQLRAKIFRTMPECTTPFLSEKTPSNFRSLGLLRAAIPEAKFVYCARDARAVCWSNFKTDFKADGLAYSNSLASTVDYYNYHLDFMEFWKQTFPGEIFYFDYELFTENQMQVTERLLDFCGLSWEQSCIDFHKNTNSVKTASHMQAHKKLYKGSSEAWRLYEEHLAPYFENLAAEKLDPAGMVR